MYDEEDKDLPEVFFGAFNASVKKWIEEDNKIMVNRFFDFVNNYYVNDLDPRAENLFGVTLFEPYLSDSYFSMFSTKLKGKAKKMYFKMHYWPDHPPQSESDLLEMDFQNQTLEEITRIEDTAEKGLTTLQSTCIGLRKKPIKSLKIEEFRLLVSQKIDLEYLIDPVLQILEKDPFVEGDYYRGGLLVAVLRINSVFFEDRDEDKQRIIKILEKAESLPNEIEIEAVRFTRKSQS